VALGLRLEVELDVLFPALPVGDVVDVLLDVAEADIVVRLTVLDVLGVGECEEVHVFNLFGEAEVVLEREGDGVAEEDIDAEPEFRFESVTVTEPPVGVTDCVEVLDEVVDAVDVVVAEVLFTLGLGEFEEEGLPVEEADPVKFAVVLGEVVEDRDAVVEEVTLFVKVVIVVDVERGDTLWPDTPTRPTNTLKRSIRK